MPQNGRIVKWSKLRFTLTSRGSVTHDSGSGFARYTHDADASTHYIVNAINEPFVGINLHAQSSFDGTTGAWEVYYIGPGATSLSPYVVTGATFLSEVTIEVVVNGVKLYCGNAGSLFNLFWDSVTVTVNDDPPVTLPSSGGVMESSGVGPNYIPLFGMPMKIGGGCIIGRDGVDEFHYNQCDPDASTMPSWEVEMNGGPTGGWDFMEEGSDEYTSLPITIYHHDPADGVNCPYGLDASGLIVGTDTANVEINSRSYSYLHTEYLRREFASTSVTTTCTDIDGNILNIDVQSGPEQGADVCTGEARHAPIYRDVFKRTTRAAAGGGSCRIVPDLEKAIVRLGDSYRALWYRFPMPQVTAAISQQCVKDGATHDGFIEPEVYPAESEFLACVGADAHVIEDIFGRPTYGAIDAARRQSEEGVFFVGGGSGPVFNPPSWWLGGHCPPDTAEEVRGFGPETWPSNPSADNYVEAELSSIVFPYRGTHTGTSQSHALIEPEYLAQWGAPHWNLAFWPSDIDCLGGPQDWKTYGGVIKQQWNYHPILPLDERLKTRNSMCLSPTRDDNGNTPWQDHFNGGMGWIGVSRFQVTERAMPADLMLSAARPGEWILRTQDHVADCTLDLSGDMGPVLSVFHANTARIEMLFMSSAFEPFWQPALAKQILVDWETTNVSSVKVSLVGIDQATTALGSTRPTTYGIPQGAEVKYAQSLCLNNGAGDIVDIAFDHLGSGMSADIMSDPHLAAKFELGSGRAFYSVRFEVTPVDKTLPVTLKWPTWIYPDTHPVVFRENSKVATLLWPDGPGLRLGQSVFWDPLEGYMLPPNVEGLDLGHTIIDGLSDGRIVFEGVNPLSGGSESLATVLFSMYDSYEGNSVAQVDDFSLTAILPKSPADETLRWAQINSFSEVPPMPCWPTQTRDESWNASAGYAQVVYDMCEETRPAISPAGVTTQIFKPDGVTPVGTPLVDPPSGWYVVNFVPALVGDEFHDWQIRKEGSTLIYAKFDPWYGFTWTAGISQPSVGRPDQTHDFLGQYYRTDVSANGDVHVRRSGSFIPPFVLETVAASGVGNGGSSICVLPGYNRLQVVYDKPGGGVFRRLSDSNAKDFNEEELVIPGGTHPFTRSDKFINVIAAYIAGTIQAVVRAAGDATAPSPITFKKEDSSDLAVEDDGFALCPAPDAAARWVLTCRVAGETELSEWFSTDNLRTWTRVTT